MIPRSLRVRLLLGATVAIFAALAAAWIAMTLLFERYIERRVAMDLTREGRQLVAGIAIGEDGVPTLSRTLADVRFNQPASGLYWQASTPSGALRSRSLWDQDLPPSTTAQPREWDTRIVDGPFDQQVLMVERIVLPESGGVRVLLQLAHEQRSLQQMRAEFGAELALFLVILWLILSAAAWVQVHLGLRPLERVKNEVETMKRNPRERLNSARLAEIEPLTRAINELADARERDLVRARRRAADLAHGLKTPLAALFAQSRRAREAGAVEAADGLDRAIATATAAVESELARSRAAAIGAAPITGRTAPLQIIESIVGVVERTEFGTQLVFEVDVPPDLIVPVADEDLMELVGPLVENAARYAKRRVRISGSTHDGEGDAVLTIEDDGPGIAAEQLAEVIGRGRRLDEAGSGHGFGLAIANDLTLATRGELALTRSDLGGLKVTVTWSGKNLTSN